MTTNAPNTPIQRDEDNTLFFKLNYYENSFDIKNYFELAIQNLEELTLNQTLFLVYSSWKLNNLFLLYQFHENDLKGLNKKEYEIYCNFLKTHQLRIDGQIDDGFKILEMMQSKSPHWVIQFRFAAESIAYYELAKATSIINKTLPLLPPQPQLILTFNLGVAALNQENIITFQFVENKLACNSSNLGTFFHSWLMGSYYQHTGMSQKSVNHFIDSIDRAQKIPSRKTDIPILAFHTLNQTVWAGDLSTSRKALEILELESKNKNNLSPQFRSLAQALFEINEGKLSEALLRIEAIFDFTHKGRDCLHAADYYLWLLLSLEYYEKGKQVIETICEYRRKQNFSTSDLEHEVLGVYFDFMTLKLSQIEFQKKLLILIDKLKLREHERGISMAQFLYYIKLDISEEKSKAFEAIVSIPFLQRIGISILSQNTIKIGFLRKLRTILNDEIAKLLLELHISRLTEDTFLFAQTFKMLSLLKATTWIQLLHNSVSSFNMDFGQSLQSTELLVDGESRRVMALESQETLDSQPLLVELLLSLLKNPHGMSKEAASFGIGYTHYDPLQHDPIIYNLISRLRDWFRKQDLNIKIITDKSGWILTQYELITFYNREKDNFNKNITSFEVIFPLKTTTPHTSNYPQNHFTLHPRLDWVLMVLNKKGLITRAEFMKRFSIQKSTAANDFNSLINFKLIQRHGKGRGIYYTLTENNR